MAAIDRMCIVSCEGHYNFNRTESPLMSRRMLSELALTNQI